MFFCSHCGFLLTPGATQCPRCGTAVKADEGAVNLYPDAPTTQSAVPGIVQQEDDRTPPNADNTPFVIQNTPRPMSYPSFPTTDHPGSISQTAQAVRRSNTGLVSATITFLLVLVIAMTLVIIAGPQRILGLIDRQATPAPIVTVTTTQATPSGEQATPSPVSTVVATATQPSTTTAKQQAQSVIVQYFSAINQKDYQSAYNLWANNPQSYNDFVQGFAHTQHDDVVIDRMVQQPDGTVRVFITLTATSDTGATSLYRGYYLVGQQADGTWKIITAHVNQA